MVEAILGFSVFAALCLATKALRLYGVLALAVLSMLYPFAAMVLAAIAGAAVLIFRNSSFI